MCWCYQVVAPNCKVCRYAPIISSADLAKGFEGDAIANVTAYWPITNIHSITSK